MDKTEADSGGSFDTQKQRRFRVKDSVFIFFN